MPDAAGAAAGHRLRVQRFVDDTIARIASHGSVQDACQLAQWLGTWLWKNTTGIYRQDALETALLQRLGLSAPRPLCDVVTHKGAEIHVATEVYPFGGHTSLMRCLIHAADATPQVLLTRMPDTSAACRRLNLPASQIQSMPTGIEDVRAWVLRMAALLSEYQRVVMHIHPNDVLSALAIRVLRTQAPDVRILFVNHADHAFSVGIGAAHRVLEISHFGWALRHQRDITSTSTFMGIPIAQPSEQTPHITPTEPSGVQLLTGGSPYKFRPVQGMSLPTALRRLLLQQPYRVTAIGPRSRDWWWWPLRLRFPCRVQVVKLLPKEAYQQLLARCSIYVDSHPLLGGTAFPEALMNGCNVSGLRGLAWGYSPADELIVDNVDAFIAHCTALVKGDQAALAAQAKVRELCILHHAPDGVRARMDQAWQADALLAPPCTQAPAPRPERLEQRWSQSATSQVPSRKECPLSASNRRWLTQAHARMMGWHHRSTWSLLRHALRA